MKVVGVHPGAELECRAMLFAALSEAFPAVRFEPRESGSLNGLDALIEIGGDSEARNATAAGMPALSALVSEASGGRAVEVLLDDGESLDRRLRGQALTDTGLEGAPALEVAAGATVLARAGSRPLWTRAGRLDVVGVAPLELEAGEALRSRLGRERSLALLPLVELLRSLADDDWQPPPLRAAFLLDDPNLHWPSYGHLNLPQMSRHAAEQGYHLALAMVPLDAWLAHPTAVRLLREQSSLSLLVHGNDHYGGELGKTEGDSEALALAAQALDRVAAFERRTGVPVSRVMAPPHEECSEAAARALARTGFAAITMTCPFPWLAPPPRHWLTAPAEIGALAGWRPADLTPGDLPVLLRHPLGHEDHSPAEMVLRAYLNQPLIMYGHHDDLADGLEVLAQRTTEINRMGPVQWASLGEIAATNVERRQEGELLRLRPYTRQISVDVPAGVTSVVVEPFQPFDSEDVVRSPLGTVPTGEPFAVEGSGPLELALIRTDAVPLQAVPTPASRPWPLARRIIGETRDRLSPTARRLRLGR